MARILITDVSTGIGRVTAHRPETLDQAPVGVRLQLSIPDRGPIDPAVTAAGLRDILVPNTAETLGASEIRRWLTDSGQRRKAAL